MEDIQKKCSERDCRKSFTITAGELEFFEGKGFPVPKRCKDCRERRKRENNSAFGSVARDFRNKGYGKGR